MGPFPHDAPPPKISDENPMGTDGFEFVEFCHPQPEELDRLFKTMGFSAVAKHRAKQVTLYRQGDINFILNAEPNSFAAKFARSARTVRAGDGVPRRRCAPRLSPCAVDGREAGRDVGRSGRTQHSGDRGHRRPADLSGRPLRRQGLDLRRRFRVAGGARSEAGRRGPLLHRSPDPQRPSRPARRMGGVLRAPLQLPPDPVLRHRRHGCRACIRAP